MDQVVNVIAVIIAIAGVAATLAHVGYLALLGTAANKRAGGDPIAHYVRSRWPIAGGTAAAAVFAWWLTAADSVGIDMIAILLAAGSGAVATKAIQNTQSRYRRGG